MRFLSFVLAAAVSTPAFAANPGEIPRLHNSAMVFTQFWDANKDKDAAAQVAAFKDTVAPVFPGFYNPARLQGMFTPSQYDGLIEGAIKEFPAIRGEYVRKAQQFESELPKYTATFKGMFPDFEPPEDIYVLHSLGEMDGGMRHIDGKSTMIFGVDSMVKFHGAGSEAAFFHHEIFHMHHSRVAEHCDDGAIWTSLWAEGLAVHVAKLLNPAASDKELLLEVPDDMATRTRAMLPEALAQLEDVLDNTDEPSYADLFSRRGEAGKLPKRRGYYLGYLVAREAGKTRDVRELARLGCGQVKSLVHSTVHSLRATAR